MRYYFAPMEGLTDSTYRALHSKHFPGMSRYYTPFLSPTMHHALTPKEKREIPPADKLNYTLIPQALTKNVQDFLWLAKQCQDFGYSEINLNFGCPSGTVTAKGKGSGMLKDPDALDAFLWEVFSKCPIPVSVKTLMMISAYIICVPINTFVKHIGNTLKQFTAADGMLHDHFKFLFGKPCRFI